MKITEDDLKRWKTNTLDVAREIGLNENILTMLKDTSTEVIAGSSGANFYGWAHYKPPRVSVYEQNPSRYFPKGLFEVWNQSGMDHELIGHIYNYYAGLRNDEFGARKTQVEMAYRRGQDRFLWRLAATFEPTIRSIQRYRNTIFYRSNSSF